MFNGGKEYMNIEKLKASGIDYEDGLSRFSGNRNLYEKYLRKLLTVTLYEEMKAALEKKDIKEAFECAHKFKAFIGNLSIAHFYEEIKNLTEELRAGEDRDFSEILQRLDREYEIILQSIKESDDDV